MGNNKVELSPVYLDEIRKLETEIVSINGEIQDFERDIADRQASIANLNKTFGDDEKTEGGVYWTLFNATATCIAYDKQHIEDLRKQRVLAKERIEQIQNGEVIL